MTARTLTAVAMASAFTITVTPAVSAQPGSDESASEQRFHDVHEDHPHHDGIQRVAEAGVATGYDDGTFRPDQDVTRAQLATLVATASHLETTQDPPFGDVAPDHPHAHGIAAAAEWDIVEGYPDGTYRPERSIDRGQMASILAGAYDLEADGDPPFDDVPDDHPHAEAIAAVAENDVADGYDDDTYRPDLAVTRGQMATLLSRADPQI